MKRDEILKKISDERDRQHDLPGSEWDSSNSPGDWIALVSHYLSSEVRRNGIAPSSPEFVDKFIKAAAIIVAAIENVDNMSDRDELE